MRDVADLGRIMAEAVTDMRAAHRGRRARAAASAAGSCSPRRATSASPPTTPIFSIPEVELGIPLAWAGIPRLVREIGPALTKELVLTCRPFSPAEAAAAGFLNRVVPADELTATVDELLAVLASRSTLDADGDEGPRQRRGRGDGLDGERPARRRHPRLGARTTPRAAPPGRPTWSAAGPVFAGRRRPCLASRRHGPPRRTRPDPAARPPRVRGAPGGGAAPVAAAAPAHRRADGFGRARPGAAARVRGSRRRRQGRRHQARRRSRSTPATTACRRSPSRRSTRSATRSCGASTG